MRKVIFIAGTGYSGSTMLDLMLSNSQDGFSCGEIHALFYPWRQHHLNPKCGCGNSNCDLWSRLQENYNKNNIHSGIFDQFSNLEYLVDSSKDPTWIKDQKDRMNSYGIDPVILLLWKDPVDYAYSCWKRRKEMNWHKRWINYYRNLFSITDQYFAVSYRDLVRSPGDILRELCNVVGIGYSPGMELFWNKVHHHLFGNNSVKSHFLKLKSIEYQQLVNLQKAEIRKLDHLQASDNYRMIYSQSDYDQSFPATHMQMARDNRRVVEVREVLHSLDFRNPVLHHSRLRSKDYQNLSYRWYWKYRLVNRLLMVQTRMAVILHQLTALFRPWIKSV